ncbi:GNAT family N-acetyltransferase [Cecembia sp.]|uniref:GNAT family N-acetyltransferase n=1 Tax=Cecembia sp. TaxID=1898110 RepID=UPI0025B9A2BF|nr:GNAT family N-acetyltransferase [Cecembia sp.]
MEDFGTLNIYHLSDEDMEKAIALMEKVFTIEQGIPRDYLPVKNDIQKSWGIRKNNRLLALAIAWWDGEIWHWGRYAVDPDYRGKGIGRQLAGHSIKALFEEDAEEIHIEARDITVNLLSKMGARIVGESFDFYGRVTPMRLSAKDFKS